MKKSLRIILTGAALMALLLGTSMIGYASSAEAEDDNVVGTSQHHSDANEGEDDNGGCTDGHCSIRLPHK